MMRYNVYMLYVLVGSDSEKRTVRTRKILDTLRTKRPDAVFREMQVDTFDVNILLEHLNTAGLFDEKSIVRLQGVCENTEHKKTLIDQAVVMHSSDNAFIITEEKLTKPDITKFEKSGATLEVFDEMRNAKEVNMFNLADLLLARNKQKLLVTFYEYTNSGHAPEELVGIMVWQLKSLNLALGHSQSDSGLKSFVYGKCIKSGWNKEQAQQTYHKLITQYHESRRGGLTLFERIEKFILEL